MIVGVARGFTLPGATDDGRLEETMKALVWARDAIGNVCSHVEQADAFDRLVENAKMFARMNAQRSE